MHSSFWHRMDGDHGGDLDDVVRSGGVRTDHDRWRLPAVSRAEEGDHSLSPLQMDFGELQDPLLPELGTGVPPGFYGIRTLLSPREASGEEILSRVLQISPIPPVIPSLLGRTTSDPAGQIASPRNPAIKRRRSQAKKVVCIPAPPSTGGRQSNEAMPSDLWAWRKYGQKPIKGSPYPRGYYRCSSSKGCLARKQVERSRTDPNMLVITYTSEHNHPWPTHRNALAGSTRSHPLKNLSPPSSSSTSRLLPSIEFQKDVPPNTGTANLGQSVKEEATEIDRMPVEDPWFENESHNSIHSDDLFADLGELGSEPMDLVFSKALDSFSMFDWGANPFEFDQARKGGL